MDHRVGNRATKVPILQANAIIVAATPFSKHLDGPRSCPLESRMASTGIILEFKMSIACETL